MLTDADIIGIRSECQKSHQLAKLALERGTMDDLEQGRDDSTEKKNAAQTVVDHCETQKDELRRQKRLLDDQIADVNKVQREFKALKEDLDLDSRRLNASFWDAKKGRKMYDPTADSATS